MASIVLISFLIFISTLLNGYVHCQKPPIVNVGAVFTFDSVIGRAAKGAMEVAAADINEDSTILNGTQLNLIMEDSNCSVFMGSIKAFQVIEKEVVAIIGPQSSGTAHMISTILNGLQVPLISFSVTDPTLSTIQFPFFIRSTQSDLSQMAAMADLIDYYGWRKVIAVYVDDDYGRNGISALDDALAETMSKISYKVAFAPGANLSQISDLLNKSKLIGPRVYVVHVSPDSGLTIFSIAQHLQMMTSDYVWFATDWLCAALDSMSHLNQTSLHLQGVVALRQYIPQSWPQKAFMSRWRELHRKGLVSSWLNAYGFYAYDTVWAVAHSIDAFLNEDRNITFSFNKKLHDLDATSMQLEELKTFDGGSILLDKLLQTNFTGLTGAVQFDTDRNLIGDGYEIVNVDKAALHRIGYWSNYSGLSIEPPETSKERGQRTHSGFDQKLNNVTWPGQQTEKPRGWVIADNERPLRIGVPKRVSFTEFVNENHSSQKIEGYCIDVFNAAQELIPYAVPYKFVPFGDGHSNPSYDELVRKVAENVFDGAVGDITIFTNRTKTADFTQPYVVTGLVIVAPIKKSSAWVYLRPFTVEMWCTTTAFFVLIGVVIWILEHRINNDFRGPPRRHLITMLLFSFSTPFKTKQETMSILGRIVMMIWLFLLMEVMASYKASLASILTVQHLSSPITGIDSLIASKWPIGYQVGSFARSYLKESFNIPSSRLIPLGTPEEYKRALQRGPSNGGVAAIVDELPYVELFLSKQADFGIIGQQFSNNGWGFAFQRGSPLAVDMSTAILKLSESGKLQEIHDKWFCKIGCAIQGRHQSDPNQLKLSSFWGLYLLFGALMVTAFLVFIIQMVQQFVQYKRKQRELTSHASDPSIARCSQVIYNFLHFVIEKEEAMKKMFKQCDNPEPRAS
ncbi:glutamate receptor 3.7-like [Telopea speciosissima]|uniref:glutamate receptor 3.7-like n=1 Tax=Telopea speciosissima TaxID=54955 RepID=UPI001CC3EDB9|nr:glutamate receptor 3.7-like [Telopea speciosissima]